MHFSSERGEKESYHKSFLSSLELEKRPWIPRGFILGALSKPFQIAPCKDRKIIFLETCVRHTLSILFFTPQVAQILIGLMKVCLFAIGLCFYSSDLSYRCYPLTMVSGYLIWGSLFFFVSGAVSIAAGRKMTLNLIKGSLGMNMLSAVVGGIGVIILTVELTVDHGPEKRCLILRVFETVILVLSLLEVSITISLSVFGCKTTCFVTQVVVIQPTNDQVPPGMAPYEHVYEDLEF
ncbi:membrane-spanning 4-domains subfamily A member 4A-like isoform X7 [Ailuropoda melanoleuca]|uniref:membrane-spanning 4-domains subfamily A member 4A-like isoform X7 n=1 Tax=Ailuropoda melanoleuca TaxID=9646 RepID=UPI001494E14E|nr:membrane-spanning 4-domains subfamily A member 4A-like isoform X7 [Ailuropoda melanoleuca]